MLVLGLMGGILVVLGTVLPWSQVGTLLVNRGMDNPDGAILLGAGIVACALCILGLVRDSSRGRWLGVLLGLLAAACFAIGLIDLGQVQKNIEEVRSTIFGDAATVGSGLYMILVGAVVLGIGGVGSLFTQAAQSPRDRPKDLYWR